MTDSAHISILRRMAGQGEAPAPPSPLTTSRAVRLALVKAANEAGNLVLSVASTAEETGPLDQQLAALDPGLLLVQVLRRGTLVGLIAVDMQLRAAMLEMQTMGRLHPQPAEERAPTATDKMLCDPLLAAFLAALPPAVAETSFHGWVDHLTLGEQIASTRVAGLELADGAYRLLHLSVNLGQGDRQGAVRLLLPLVATVARPVMRPAPVADWQNLFTAAVQGARATLVARLHRFSLPLGQAQALRAGQVVPLWGCTVQSVRLIAPDGREVARAKLGQAGGYRAVRLLGAPSLQMQDFASAAMPAAGYLDPPVMAAPSEATDYAASAMDAGGFDGGAFSGDFGGDFGADAAGGFAADPASDLQDPLS